MVIHLKSNNMPIVSRLVIQGRDLPSLPLETFTKLQPAAQDLPLSRWSPLRNFSQRRKTYPPPAGVLCVTSASGARLTPLPLESFA